MSEFATKEMEEFLKADGAAGVIVGVDPHDGSIQGAIEDRAPVSAPTVSNRIDDACNLNLMQEIPLSEGDHPNSTRYGLTEDGRALQKAFTSLRYDDVCKVFRSVRKVQKEIIDEVVRWQETYPGDEKTRLDDDSEYDSFVLNTESTVNEWLKDVGYPGDHETVINYDTDPDPKPIHSIDEILRFIQTASNRHDSAEEGAESRNDDGESTETDDI